jgi:nicotinamidase-related amidase
LGDPASTAVVFIECQVGVIGEKSILPNLRAELGNLVERLARLADAARSAGVLVAHATSDGSRGGRGATSAPLNRMLTPQIADWGPGHPGTAVVPELLADTDVVLSRQHGLMPTHNTDLIPYLRRAGIKTVIFAGVSANVSIPLCTGEATEEGFDVVIARDALGGSPADYVDAVVSNTLAMLATISTIDELAAHWGAPAY